MPQLNSTYLCLLGISALVLLLDLLHPWLQRLNGDCALHLQEDHLA